MSNETKHTPGPWDYVPSSEHHGPYVTTDFGSTVCDFYVMSNPFMPSVRNGGESRPIPHLAEMADANARLTAAAPDLLTALKFSEALRVGEIEDMISLGWSMEGYETGSAFAVRIAQEAIAKATAEKI